MQQELSLKLTEVILGLDAEAGRAWLAALPAIVDEIAARWSLSVGEPYPNLSYHYVASCRCRDGSEAVLKLGFPLERKTLSSEAKMLNLMGGEGMVKLLRFDEKRCALLLEKLTPGENLKTICGKDEVRAARIAVGIMRRLRREPPADNSFQRLEDWFEGFKKAEKTEFNSDALKKARRSYEELSPSADRKMLLHGDLHHENILSAQREPFLAIDPKGIVGDAAYEPATFLINQANWAKNDPRLRERLAGAVREFSEGLEIEPQIIRKWTFAQAVLSAWWTFEENGESWKEQLAFANIWEELKI